MRRFRIRLDPPLTAEEWLIAGIFAAIGLAGGYSYGLWIWGQAL